MKGGFTLQRSLLRTNEELAQIYNRHVTTVYNVCFMYMKNPHDTEDMVQNTFIRLMRDPTRFESEEHEKAWLIRTAINLCKDFFRSWWVSKTTDIDKAENVTVGPPLEQNEILIKVLSLPQKYKTAIYLYYYEGYSSVEIAKCSERMNDRQKLSVHRKKLLKIEMKENRTKEKIKKHFTVYSPTKDQGQNAE